MQSSLADLQTDYLTSALVDQGPGSSAQGRGNAADPHIFSYG